MQTKSEVHDDRIYYDLVKRVRKTAAGRSIAEFYCVYINQEEGKTKAITVGRYEDCPEKEK
tara:strand:+ start:111 stop:293 length:183 start_codon:yes stop_codon:yes gene_type:complete